MRVWKFLVLEIPADIPSLLLRSSSLVVPRYIGKERPSLDAIIITQISGINLSAESFVDEENILQTSLDYGS